jgi:intracellular sulfur oxidation DsrE/DsrF family protein
MKRKFFFILCLVISAQCFSQKDYRVVFDLTSGDSLSQQMALRWMNEVVKADPSAQVELVMFGKGLPLAITGKSAVADGVAQLVNNKQVNIYVCAVALANQKLDKSQLLPGIQTVPDGIYEIITKQRQGWGYIKVAH